MDANSAPRSRSWILLWALALSAGLFACDCGGGGGVDGKGDGGGSDADLCSGPDAPPICGEECSNHDDCGTGSYCNNDNVCAVDCSPPGSACGEDGQCDITGRCREGAGEGGVFDPDACVDVELEPQRVVPNVVLLVDKSGSMDGDDISLSGSTLQRWNALRELLIGRCSSPGRDPGSCGDCDSLVSGSVGIVGETDDRVNYGLMIYPGGSGETACGDRISVPVAPDNYTAIRDTFMQTSCSGATPTEAAFDDVMASLYDPQDSDPTIVILATDGSPNNCTCRSGFDSDNWDCGSCCLNDRIATEAGVVDTVEAAYQGEGVTTYVIAISNDIAGNPHFQEVANVGQGYARDGSAGDATLYEASDGAALQLALDEIITSNISCEIDLRATVAAADLCKGTVTLDGTPLQCNGPDGFERVDDQHIRLVGDACESWKLDANAVLQAKWPCGTVIIIVPG